MVEAAGVAGGELRVGRGDRVSFAIIRGGNGRRHEVDFGDDPIQIDVTASTQTVQITVEAVAARGPGRGCAGCRRRQCRSR